MIVHAWRAYEEEKLRKYMEPKQFEEYSHHGGRNLEAGVELCLLVRTRNQTELDASRSGRTGLRYSETRQRPQRRSARDSTADLIEAASERDHHAAKEAALRLERSCIECHALINRNNNQNQ